MRQLSKSIYIYYGYTIYAMAHLRLCISYKQFDGQIKQNNKTKDKL